MTKILLIDDQPLLLASLKWYLKKNLSDVIIFNALSKKEALDKIEDEEVDIIFLDEDMPDSEVLSTKSSNPDSPDEYVLFSNEEVRVLSIDGRPYIFEKEDLNGRYSSGLDCLLNMKNEKIKNTLIIGNSSNTAWNPLFEHYKVNLFLNKDCSPKKIQPIIEQLKEFMAKKTSEKNAATISESSSSQEIIGSFFLQKNGNSPTPIRKRDSYDELTLPHREEAEEPPRKQHCASTEARKISG